MNVENGSGPGRNIDWWERASQNAALQCAAALARVALDTDSSSQASYWSNHDMFAGDSSRESHVCDALLELIAVGLAGYSSRNVTTVRVTAAVTSVAIHVRPDAADVRTAMQLARRIQRGQPYPAATGGPEWPHTLAAIASALILNRSIDQDRCDWLMEHARKEVWGIRITTHTTR